MQDTALSLLGRSSCNAFVLENSVFHARYLPSSSKHAFRYPTLALHLRLSSLESHALDLCSGRLFGYSDAGSSSPWARITGCRPEAYLHDPNSHYAGQTQGKSIKSKLQEVLKRFEIDPSEMEDAWMMTMPSYLGVEGINPLTVFYCYKRSSTDAEEGSELVLWVVVLEVHNTFGERHVYVLRTGAEHEDEKTVPGFTHSWTFPRQFHVSPFNDRSGFYTCSLVPPPLSPRSFRLAERAPSLPKILIQLWTTEGELRLTASLRSTSSVPLNTRNLVAALIKYPFTLLLSFPRIVWQAFHLHYSLKLDVYARPEPRAVDAIVENLFSKVEEGGYGRKMVLNDVQRKNGELGVGGGLGWQPEGLLERFARNRVERFLKMRARETRIKIWLASTNPTYETKTYAPALLKDDILISSMEELTIATRSSRAFLLIFASPSPAHALLLARDAEGLLAVSDEKLFLEVFSLGRHQSQVTTSYIFFTQRMLQRLRQLPIPRTLLRDPKLLVANIYPLDAETSFTHSRHPLQSLLMFLLPALSVISAFLALTYFEKLLFFFVGARFVRGTEPWGLWERAEKIWLVRRKGKEKCNLE